jgi:hypothetical protein
MKFHVLASVLSLSSIVPKTAPLAISILPAEKHSPHIFRLSPGKAKPRRDPSAQALFESIKDGCGKFPFRSRLLL